MMAVPLIYNNKEVTYKKLHLAFINKFDLNDEKYKSLIINEELVDFFTHDEAKEET